MCTSFLPGATRAPNLREQECLSSFPLCCLSSLCLSGRVPVERGQRFPRPFPFITAAELISVIEGGGVSISRFLFLRKHELLVPSRGPKMQSNPAGQERIYPTNESNLSLQTQVDSQVTSQ